MVQEPRYREGTRPVGGVASQSAGPEERSMVNGWAWHVAGG